MIRGVKAFPNRSVVLPQNPQQRGGPPRNKNFQNRSFSTIKSQTTRLLSTQNSNLPVNNSRWTPQPLLAVSSRSFATGTTYQAKPSERVEESKDMVKERMATISVKQMLEMKAKPAVYVDKDETLFKAITMMSKNNCGSVLVTKQEGNARRLLGVFTERDYVRKIILKGLSSKTTKLSDVMTPNPICATPRNTLEDCARLMVTHNFRHLPILENENDYSSKILGVLSSKDIIERLVEVVEQAEDFKLTGTVSDVFDKAARTSSVGIFVESDQKVIKALEVMEKNNGGAVLVHEGTQLVGIFTERDYLHKIILQNRSSHETTVGEVMTPTVFGVHCHTTIKEALDLFVEKGIRNIPIVNLAGGEIMDERGMPMGMISSHNVMKFIIKFHRSSQR